MFARFRYRIDVKCEFCKILLLLPDGPKVLKIDPRWKLAVELGRKNRLTPKQTALLLGCSVLEHVIQNISETDRNMILDDLKRYAGKSGWEFMAFSEWFLHFKTTGKQVYPQGMQVMTIALGTSFYVVNLMKRNGEIKSQDCDAYIAGIVGMLEGRTDAERRKDRGALILRELRFD